MMRLLLWLLIAGLLAVPAGAATYTATANRDSHLRQDNPGSNYGGLSEMDIRVASGDNRRPIIGFTLPAIPAGEVITSATIRLYVTGGTAAGTASLHRVTDSWTEGGVTWSNTSADFNAAAEDTEAVNSIGAFITFDVTALVRGWRDSTFANHGVMAIGGGGINGRFGSSENGTSSRRPLLTITTVVAPVLAISKANTAVSDPFNGSTNPKAIPGAVIGYSISVSNSANGNADSGTTVVTEAIPADMMLFVGDLGGVGSGPVTFSNGSPSSGLSYTFAGLASTTDSLSFSNDGGANYTYVPTPDAGGFDAAVTHVRINPSGSFAANTGSGNPTFSLSLRMQVE